MVLFIFMVQIMAISGIIKTKFIAKTVIRSKLHTAFNTFIMCNMASLQSYLYILNHLDSILDAFPTYIYLVLLYI